MHTIPSMLMPLALTARLAYSVSVRIRNSLYDASILPQHRLHNPVISIGNITTGGTGKTPLAIFTARKILELGFTPAILSRGYGRSSRNISRIISPNMQLQSPAMEIGDEPALIRRHVPEAWFGISKDRFSVGSRIERDESNAVFILDDGFQHRKLHRDLDIVIIDSSQPLGSNRIFPHGTLREPLSGLCRCDILVINDSQLSLSEADPLKSEMNALKLKTGLYHCEQFIERLVSLRSWSDSGKRSDKQIESAFLVAAIGNPARFQSDIHKLGIRITESRFYRDHYRIRPSDWNACIESARKTGAGAIIVTEKDAVKITEPPGFPVFVAVQETRFAEEEPFNDLLCRSIMSK